MEKWIGTGQYYTYWGNPNSENKGCASVLYTDHRYKFLEQCV